MGSSQSARPGSASEGDNNGCGGGSDAYKLALSRVRGFSGGGAAGGCCGCGCGDCGGCGGGCCGDCAGGFFGGAEDADPAKGLREYGASLSARTKEDLIRRLARALGRAGLSVDPEGDIDEIVRQLVAQIPNPKNKKTFSSDAHAQEKVCRTIADVLNDEFTPGESKASRKLIDTSLSAVEICRSVGDWAHNFAAGVNTEFLAVHGRVKDVLTKIQILDQIMSELYSKIRGKVVDSKDPEMNRDFDPLDDIYTRAQNERRLQEEVLKNILHVHLSPAAKELEIAMRDDSEQNSLIKRIGLKPGTSEFADTLAMAISGLGTAASVAARVHKALKEVGVSVRQYLASPSYKELSSALDAKLLSRQVKAEDFAKFIEAVNVLRQNFDSRAEPRFREALEAEGDAKHGGARHGGDDEYKTSIDKRVDRAKAEKKVIVRDFVNKMSRHYDDLLAAVKSLGPELGKKIPLTDKTDALRDALVRLRDMRESRIELALVGLYTDVGARERKEHFVNALRIVSSTCTMLMELEMYRAAGPFLARLKESIDALQRTVDTYSDVIVKKFGGEGDAVVGGAADDLLPEIARSGLSLAEAVSEFAYFYYVAKVRSNLDQSARELEVFGEKTAETLGDAVAARLWKLGQEKLAITGRLTDANRSTAGTPENTEFKAPGDAAGNAAFAAAKKWVDDEFSVKEKFYRALQAMELYMKAFTLGIVKDPDAVRDIKKMLDGTQVIARWFSEQTGDALWRAFECMQSVDFNAGGVVPGDAGQFVRTTDEPAMNHYYDRVAVKAAGRLAPNAVAAASTFGVPQAGVPAGVQDAKNDGAALAKKSISDTMDYFQALKNLVNGFARIGDKFGGREIRAQVFMSPTQIYKSLVDYMKQSALSLYHFSGAGAAPPACQLTCWRPEALPVTVGAAVPPYHVYFGSVQASVAGNYQIEDRYFALIIKSMGAKILTTLGVYDMFERRTPLYDLTPTRMIVGGADDADPEVIEGAAELYFRLPRLIEFYRGILRWEGEGTNQLKIAMLPELEGIFSGIIRLIFRKLPGQADNDYSDGELRSIINEINMIYTKFHAEKADRAVSAALDALVMEVNRRYGVIKSEDMQKYWALLARTRREEGWGIVNDTNYAILPDEGESDVDRRAPSDRYVTQLPGAPAPAAGALPREFVGRPTLDENAGPGTKWALLREFRSKLDSEFRKVQNQGQFGVVSYSLLIKQAESEMRRATGKDQKLAVAMRLIQSGTTAGISADKAFMFHETVVVGLNTLSAIQTMLDRFSAAVDALNPATLEDAIMDRMYAAATVAGAVARGALTRADLEGWLGAAPAIARVDRLAVIGQTYMRGAMAGPISAAEIYGFGLGEFNGIQANAGRQLPAGRVPSSYSELNPGDLSADQLSTLRGLRVFARLVTDYAANMQQFVEAIFDVQATLGGLVEVRYTQSASTPIAINFSKLRNLSEKLLADVKYYLDLFRQYLPKQVIARFEESGAGNEGSVFWLEQNLIDKFFHAETEESKYQDQTLDGISRRVSKAYNALITKRHAALTPGIVAGANRAAFVLNQEDPNAAGRVETYGTALAQLVFYDASRTNSGVSAAPAVVDANYALGKLIQGRMANNRSNEALRTGDGTAGAPRVAITRIPVYTDSSTDYRSLLFAFNQILANYLATVTDTSGGQKIYINLISAYANGVAARSVTAPDGNSYPDLVTTLTFGSRGDPKAGAVLAQSLAYVIQRLVKDVASNTQFSEHLVNNLVDVPLYMKESYRVNLPGYIRLFDLIIQKGDFIKQLIQKTNIDCSRPSQQAAVGAAPGMVLRAAGGVNIAAAMADAANAVFRQNALNALDPLDAGMASDEMKAKITAIIDAISAGAFTLSSGCAAEVLRELADQPVYFQTQEGSIETYRTRYGKMPLMPLSLSLMYLNDVGARTAEAVHLYPATSFGEPNFKAQYGVRGLLARPGPVGYDQMPGVKSLLDTYNGTSGARERIDPARYLEFAQNVVASLRYITEARNYKLALSTDPAVFSSGSLIGAAIRTGANGNAAYPIGKPTQRIITVVESSDPEGMAATLVEGLGGGGAGTTGDRSLELLYNLIDMNIVPINVHGLMRDVPLANLYNYGYTFEQMVVAMYGEDTRSYTDPGHAITNEQTRTTRQMFLRLLVNPYLDFGTGDQGLKLYGSDVYDLGSAGFVHRIFRGDNNLGMGRPKFLSDQLFNKALFGSVYQLPEDYDESGPGTGAGIARGRQNVGLRHEQTNVVEQVGRVVANLRSMMAYVTPVLVVAANVAGALDDSGAGDAAANVRFAAAANPAVHAPGAAGPETLNQTMIRVVTAAVDELVSVRAVLQPLRGDADFNAVSDVINEASAASASATPHNAATNLRGVLTLLGAGTAAQSRAAYNALRGLLTGGAALPCPATVDVINEVLVGGVGGVALRTLRAVMNVRMRTPLAAPLATPGSILSQSAAWAPALGRRETRISYLAAENKTNRPEDAVVVREVGAVPKRILETIGRLRFDTRFVRNLFFITNVLRLVRLKLNRELTQSRNVLVSSHNAVASGITEYGSDPFTPNEVFSSVLPSAVGDGMSRYNDRDPF